MYALDGEPAWEVWQRETREAARRLGIDPAALDEAEVFDRFLNVFEAGIDTGGEHKIRVPLRRGDAGSVVFGCGIPEGTLLRVMQSEPQWQIDSAREAARRAVRGLHGRKPAGGIVFDCSCRKSILRERFSEAVRGISHELGATPLAGFETYGEIALGEGDMSGFHNTTSVVLAFPQADDGDGH